MMKVGFRGKIRIREVKTCLRGLSPSGAGWVSKAQTSERRKNMSLVHGPRDSYLSFRFADTMGIKRPCQATIATVPHISTFSLLQPQSILEWHVYPPSR